MTDGNELLLEYVDKLTHCKERVGELNQENEKLKDKNTMLKHMVDSLASEIKQLKAQLTEQTT